MSFGRQPDFFLLVLIRGDFYNRVYTGLDGPPTLGLENEKFSNVSEVAITAGASTPLELIEDVKSFLENK